MAEVEGDIAGPGTPPAASGMTLRSGNRLRPVTASAGVSGEESAEPEERVPVVGGNEANEGRAEVGQYNPWGLGCCNRAETPPTRARFGRTWLVFTLCICLGGAPVLLPDAMLKQRVPAIPLKLGLSPGEDHNLSPGGHGTGGDQPDISGSKGGVKEGESGGTEPKVDVLPDSSTKTDLEAKSENRDPGGESKEEKEEECIRTTDKFQPAGGITHVPDLGDKIFDWKPPKIYPGSAFHQVLMLKAEFVGKVLGWAGLLYYPLSDFAEEFDFDSLSMTRSNNAGVYFLLSPFWKYGTAAQFRKRLETYMEEHKGKEVLGVVVFDHDTFDPEKLALFDKMFSGVTEKHLKMTASELKAMTVDAADAWEQRSGGISVFYRAWRYMLEPSNSNCNIIGGARKKRGMLKWDRNMAVESGCQARWPKIGAKNGVAHELMSFGGLTGLRSALQSIETDVTLLIGEIEAMTGKKLDQLQTVFMPFLANWAMSFERPVEYHWIATQILYDYISGRENSFGLNLVRDAYKKKAGVWKQKEDRTWWLDGYDTSNFLSDDHKDARDSVEEILIEHDKTVGSGANAQDILHIACINRAIAMAYGGGHAAMTALFTDKHNYKELRRYADGDVIVYYKENKQCQKKLLVFHVPPYAPFRATKVWKTNESEWIRSEKQVRKDARAGLALEYVATLFRALRTRSLDNAVDKSIIGTIASATVMRNYVLMRAHQDSGIAALVGKAWLLGKADHLQIMNTKFAERKWANRKEGREAQHERKRSGAYVRDAAVNLFSMSAKGTVDDTVARVADMIDKDVGGSSMAASSNKVEFVKSYLRFAPNSELWTKVKSIIDANDGENKENSKKMAAVRTEEAKKKGEEVMRRGIGGLFSRPRNKKS